MHHRDPAIKRKLCRHCNLPQLPGITCQIRIKSLPGAQGLAPAHRCSAEAHGVRSMIQTCTYCRGVRRLPLRPGYSIRTEREEDA